MKSKINIFDSWNYKKQNVHKKDKVKHFKERDVLLLHIGKNIGCEQNGKGKDFLRPVLVYKKFSAQSFLGIPLTSISKDSKFYQTFLFKNKESTAILSQIKLFDSKRIAYFYGRISIKKFKLVQEKLMKLLQ